MKQSFVHGRSRQEAREIAERALDHYQERFDQYDPTVNWREDHKADVEFNVDGQRLGGCVRVRDDDIELDMNVPEEFNQYKGPAMPYVEKELRRWFESAD